MFQHFTPRHIPPLLLSTAITIGSFTPFTRDPEYALRLFGFADPIAGNRAAWPLVKVMSARVSTIGTALWVMYLGGHVEAMDILFASMGWMALVDGVVCAKDGKPGSTSFRAASTGVVALWGLLGMTSGKYF
ncbi:hypothetical protein BDW02DRAFT_374516 [Decorospora gaudefroyi]|uniref:Integral membrane protein n=1 Tax=Decorospora gaudefroyi TaxID=184978 RepID=A0A6A5KBF9_9PLEO|nr:hypothetical protein BDW02DRAFT_374516 [Decorospora gaudefroyi]